MTTFLIPNTPALSTEHVKCYNANVHSENFHLLHRVLINRIAFGYSTQEVSFLLGRHKNYISKIESFRRNLEHLDTLLIPLAYIYRCSIDNFLPSKPFPKESIHVQLKQINTEKSTVYEAFQKKESELILLFRLIDFHYFSSVNNTIKMNTEKQLFNMFHSGFFNEPKDALEILHEMRRRMGYVKPCYIENWINLLTNCKRDNKLERGKDKGIYIYSKIK